MANVPDLWDNDDAPRLYSLYLYRLRLAGSLERVVEACREIRSLAVRHEGEERGAFAIPEEIDALFDLRRLPDAWKSVRAAELTRFGRKLEMPDAGARSAEAMFLEDYHRPLLYFLGRYRVGCRLAEVCLSRSFAEQRPRSYDLMFQVCNAEPEPSSFYRVTLWHYYEKLGRSLGEWEHWEPFVYNFHPRLFKLAAISRQALREMPELMPEFHERLMAIRDERTPTGCGGGQSDLTDSPARVRKRQEKIQSALEARKGDEELFQGINNRLDELFPEASDLPRIVLSRLGRRAKPAA